MADLNSSSVALPDDEDRAPRAVSRREALQLAWLAAMGVGAVAGGRSIARSLAGPPPPWPGTRAPAVLGSLATLPSAGSSPQLVTPEHIWWVAEPGGGIALRDVCPHVPGDCRIQWKMAEHKFVCPCHGAQFEREGRYIQGPAARHLDRYVVRAYDADKRIVAVTDADGLLRGAPRDSTIVVEQAVGFREAR